MKASARLFGTMLLLVVSSFALAASGQAKPVGAYLTSANLARTLEPTTIAQTTPLVTFSTFGFQSTGTFSSTKGGDSGLVGPSGPT